MATLRPSEESAPTILVVDDSQENLELLHALLSAEGYIVRLARGGTYALTSARADPPDLVLLDVLMPDLDGFAVCRELKADPGTSDAPILFLSALQESFDKVRAFASGAVDYISKPFDEREVLARVGTHLRLRRLQQELERRNRELEREVAAREQAERSLREQAVTLEQQVGLLRESETRFRAVWENSLDAMALSDEAGTMLNVNPAFARLYGYREEELISKPVTLIFAEERREWAKQGYRALFAGPETSHQIEADVRRADGSDRVVESYATFLLEGERRVALLSTVRDITERKTAEAELQRSRDQLEARVSERTAELAEATRAASQQRDLLYALVDGIEEGLLLLDQSGHVQIANRALARLLGIAPELLEGLSWPELATRFVSNGSVEDGQADRSAAPPRRIRYAGPAGKTHILDLHEQLREQTGQTIVRITDVTETTQLEARLLANERFVAAGRLAASVAHEINTPLQSIQIALEMVTVAPRDEGLTYVREAAHETRRVGSIVRQLLDLYRPAPEAGGPVDLNALVKRVLLLLRKRAHDQGVQLDLALAASPPQVHGRSDELTQVVINLVVNGLEAMRQGGQLRIATLNQDDEARLSVSDTGPGITPELLTTIFEPFVTTKASGTGQGLSITKQIVERHRGRIEVRSEPGRGATFTVVLPASRELARSRELGGNDA